MNWNIIYFYYYYYILIIFFAKNNNNYTMIVVFVKLNIMYICIKKNFVDSLGFKISKQVAEVGIMKVRISAISQGKKLLFIFYIN